MPQMKGKFYSKTGKVKIKKPANVRIMGIPTSSTSGNERSQTEIEQQFELELCWCIQQLENSLRSGKLESRQAQDAEKNLKVLKSSNQPIIKKRQLMRTLFGDYRAKMIAEEKKMLPDNKRIKFVPTQPSKKSHFVKKAAFLALEKGEFKFDFPLNELEQISLNETTEQKLKDASVEVNTDSVLENINIKSLLGGKSFQFNFQIEKDDSANLNNYISK